MSEQLKSINDLKKSLEYMGEDELRRTLTYLIKVYVLDRDSKKSNSSLMPADKDSTFVDLITALKREYQTPELDMFQLESGKVYFEMDNRRVEVSKSDSLMPTPAPLMNEPTMNIPVENPVPSRDIDEDHPPQRFKSLEF